MKNRNGWFIIGALLIAGIVIFGIRQSQKEEQPQEVRIAAILPLTGPLAFFGEPERDVLTMALEEANKSGGVQGRKVRLIIEDSKASAKDGVSALQKALLAKPVAAITSLTIVSNATQPVLTSEKIPQIALSVHPTLARQSVFTIRPYYGFEEEMKAVVGYLTGRGYKRLGILWVMVPECETAITEVLTPEMNKAGGRIVSSEPYNLGDSSVRPQLRKVIAQNPDAILVMDFGNLMGTILKEATSLGAREKIIAGIGLLTAPPIEPKLLEGIPVVGPAFVIHNSPRYQEFSRKFEQSTGKKATYDALYTYDAFNLLIEAMKRHSAQSEKIPDTIRSMQEFTGASGKMKIQPDGNVTVEVAIGVYQNGAIIPIEDQNR